MRKCPHCKSNWVCWNWVRMDTEWGHECHNCSACFSTTLPVDDGISYKSLMAYGQFFVEDGLFDKNMAKDWTFLEEHFGRDHDKQPGI